MCIYEIDSDGCATLRERILEAAERLKEDRELDLPLEQIAKEISNWIEEYLTDIEWIYRNNYSLSKAIDKANTPYAIARENAEAATERQLEAA
jgi:hypothetical protein